MQNVGGPQFQLNAWDAGAIYGGIGDSRMMVISFLLGCIAMGQSSTTSSSAQHVTSGVYIVNASVAELADGYNKWQGDHPNVVQAGKSLRVNMPIIDLYSTSGILLYHGEDSATNAAFLRTLPEGIGKAKTSVARPSLKEAIEMFPELKAQEDALLADKRYTIFAITYPDWDHCKDQNEAVAKLRENKAQANIRIIEVRLHK